MAGQVSYEEEGSGVVVTWTGAATGEELKKVNESIYAEGRLDRLRYQIWDFTKADHLDVSHQDLRALALQDRKAAETNPNPVIAIVGSREFFVGYDALFHVYEEGWSGFKSKTLPTMAEARQWVSSIAAEPAQ
jgi:hypothetical protein